MVKHTQTICQQTAEFSCTFFRKTRVRPATLLKRDSDTGVSYEICEIFKNTFFPGRLGWLLVGIETEHGKKWILKTVIQRCSVKKVLLKISHNSQEITVPESIFYTFAGLQLATLLKKRLWHRCFLAKFAKFLKISIFIEHLWWLLLKKAFKSHNK